MVRRLVVLLVISVALVGPARNPSALAQEPSAEVEVEPAPAIEEDPEEADDTRAAADDASFGPVVTIERVEVIGNVLTADRLIRRALLVQEGDALPSGNPRLRNSRFRVLALGYFVDVQLRLERGSARGLVVLTVEVWERGTLILNRVFLGASEATPLWAGLDLGDGNFLGTGLTVSGAFVAARAPAYEGGEAQWALRLRYGDPSVLGLPMGVSAAFLYNRASEPERRPGPLVGSADDPDNYVGFGYRRVGGIAGVSWDLTRQISLLGKARFELVSSEASIYDWLDAGDSRVASLTVGVERDSRADPVLPQSGDYAYVDLELGGAALGGSYDFARVSARWQHWFPLRGERHVLSLGAGAGIIFGRPAGFDLLHVSELDRLLPPRPLDLTVSTQAPLDVFGWNSDAPRYGTLGGVVELEYRYRLFRRTRLVYGGDLFMGAGVFALENARPIVTDRPQLPGNHAVDLTFDIGVRLDTEVGIFEVSFANALGRIPL